MTKEQARAVIEQMPEEFTVDQIIERLILMAEVDLGLEAIRKGEVVSLAEAREIAKGWAK